MSECLADALVDTYLHGRDAGRGVEPLVPEMRELHEAHAVEVPYAGELRLGPVYAWLWAAAARDQRDTLEAGIVASIRASSGNSQDLNRFAENLNELRTVVRDSEDDAALAFLDRLLAETNRFASDAASRAEANASHPAAAPSSARG